MSMTVIDFSRIFMTQITARLADNLVAALDKAAARLNRTRADVVRQAIEYYIADVEDLTQALQVLNDPADPVLDWDEVKRALHRKD
jgi:Predicted DNA-binding protein with an HTH domain